MALKPCKECGEMVSTKAETCPHCGNPLKVHRSFLEQLIWFVVILAVLWFILKVIGTQVPL
jgi:RNA polymerase subunit RPABC4/transcription elongation factor Spt4